MVYPNVAAFTTAGGSNRNAIGIAPFGAADSGKSDVAYDYVWSIFKVQLNLADGCCDSHSNNWSVGSYFDGFTATTHFNFADYVNCFFDGSGYSRLQSFVGWYCCFGSSCATCSPSVLCSKANQSKIGRGYLCNQCKWNENQCGYWKYLVHSINW